FVGFGDRVADLDRVGAVIVLGEVDQLTVVRLAQQLLHLGRLDGLGIALDLGHGFAELFGAHRAGIAAQAADRLLDHAEGAVQRERTAALLRSDFRCGLVRRHGLWASGLLVAAPPSATAASAPAPAAAFAALAPPIRSIRRGGRGAARHT